MITKSQIKSLSKKLVAVIGSNKPVVIAAPYYKKTTISFHDTGYVYQSQINDAIEIIAMFFMKHGISHTSKISMNTNEFCVYIEGESSDDETGESIGTLCIDAKSLDFEV